MEFKEFKNETGKILKEYWITPSEWDALDKTTVQEGDIYHIVGTISEEDLSPSLMSKVENIVQETGEATDKVISQKAVTDSLNNKVNYTDISNGLTVVDGKVKANIAKIQASDSTEFVPDEKGVVTIPGATNTNFQLGLFTSRDDLGLSVFGGPGIYYVVPAAEATITNRTKNHHTIQSRNLNFAVKAALTDDKRIGTETSGTNTAFTDTEKDRACDVLGAARTTALDNVVNELGNYEKSPNYVLIEKVITGYTVLETEPEDFTTNYASYYKTNGKARNDIDFAYVALTEAPTSFEVGKYYYKNTEAAVLDRYGESGKGPDGTPYAFKNMYLYFENLQTEWAAYNSIHFYNGNSLFPYHFYLSRNNPAKLAEVYANIYGNMMTALSTKLNSEMHANSDISIMRATIKDNMILSGFKVGKLPADTTVLIYGAK